MTIENVMHNTLWFVKYTNTYQGVKCIDKITPIIYCIYNMHTYVCIKLCKQRRKKKEECRKETLQIADNYIMKQHANTSALLQSNPAPYASACLPFPVHYITNPSSACVQIYDPVCFSQPSYSSACLTPAAYNPYRRFYSPVSSSFDQFKLWQLSW